MRRREHEGLLRLFLTRTVRTGERFAQHRGRDSTPNGAVKPMVVVRLRAQLPLVDLTATPFCRHAILGAEVLGITQVSHRVAAPKRQTPTVTERH